MAIIGYHGTPGSGKTYSAVTLILDNLKRGRVVYTNISGFADIKCREAVKAYCDISDLALEIQLKVFDDGQTEEFWSHVPPRALVVLDEVQNFFNNRDWQKQENREFGRWGSTHRKKGFDVILITQRPERVEKAVIDLIEFAYFFRKVNFFGSAVKNKYIVYSYPEGSITGQPLSKKIKNYDWRIFACYKSYDLDDIQELEVQKHVNVLKHPIIYAIPCVIAFTIYMVSQSTFVQGDLFGSKKHMESITTNEPVDTIDVGLKGFAKLTQDNGVLKFSNRKR